MSGVSLTDGFMAFSAELTGFSVFELRATGEAEAYLDERDPASHAGRGRVVDRGLLGGGAVGAAQRHVDHVRAVVGGVEDRIVDDTPVGCALADAECHPSHARAPQAAGEAGTRFRFLLENDAALEEMADRSSRCVASRYLWSDVADAYERLLEGLC